MLGAGLFGQPLFGGAGFAVILSATPDVEVIMAADDVVVGMSADDYTVIMPDTESA